MSIGKCEKCGDESGMYILCERCHNEEIYLDRDNQPEDYEYRSMIENPDHKCPYCGQEYHGKMGHECDL